MRISIDPSRFNPWQLMAEYEESVQRLHGPDYGATAVFVGTMRDFNDGSNVSGMELEHYPGMTEKELARIAGEAADRWPLVDGMIHHRVGRIEPGEAIVLVAVWSAHRGEAFDGCRHIMEALKSRAPFWKKEQRAEGHHWVAHNTSGYAEEKK